MIAKYVMTTLREVAVMTTMVLHVCVCVCAHQHTQTNTHTDTLRDKYGRLKLAAREPKEK